MGRATPILKRSSHITLVLDTQTKKAVKTRKTSKVAKTVKSKAEVKPEAVAEAAATETNTNN
jgi:hypothetical protein